MYSRKRSACPRSPRKKAKQSVSGEIARDRRANAGSFTDTLGRLWVWLHECYHMENHQHVWIGQPPSRQEAEALGTSSQLPFQSLTDAH